MADFELIVIGGGVAGAALGRSLAERGRSVLVLERTTVFKDRVRGEQLQPWGVAEARALGLLPALTAAGAHQQPWIDIFLGGHPLGHRDLSATTPQQAGHLNFPHAAVQERLLSEAAAAGADVRRGVEVTGIRRGARPVVMFSGPDGPTEATARLVVGADGRFSAARRWGAFTESQDPPFLVIAGVLLDDVRLAEDTGQIHMHPGYSQGAYLFPQGGGRVRCYAAYPASAGYRHTGDDSLPGFVETAVQAGAPATLFAGARLAGPLASFDAADTWVEHPYRDGVALIGDAAASADPSWGQGLSLTLRDARELRDRLLESDDWDMAAHAYAHTHDRYTTVMREVTHACKDLFLRGGPEADARRARALPLMAEDPTRLPDHPFSGPDLPWNAEVRRRFFGEDVAA